MRRDRNRRAAWSVGIAVLVVMAVGACTVTRAGECLPSDAGTGGTAAAPVKGSTTPLQGVTDDEITVSMLSVDLGMLADQGLAPDIGNPAKVAQAVVDDINAKGGVAGRKLVLKSHVLDANSALINPQLGQSDCIAATEQDKPAAVIVSAALPSSLVRCVSVTHPVLSMTMNQWDDTLYKDGEGRIFSCCAGTSIRMNRVYKAWPGLMVDAGALKKGDRVGIISQQPGGVSTDNRDAIENALLPSLEKVGAKVVGAAELPCPESSQTCAQHQAAIQKLKDAKAKVVFLTASNLAAATTVQAAKDLDYHPTWVTIGDNTTNTVANFFEPVKGEWDGAYGVAASFTDASDDSAACNRIADKAGVTFPKGSDGYFFTALTCLQVKVLAEALGTIDGSLTQAKLIAALEKVDPVPTTAGPEGTFGPEKHDASNNVYLARYSAASGTWKPIGGAEKAIEVP